jgi:hypothetical protein
MVRLWATGAVPYTTNAAVLSDPYELAKNLLWVLAIPLWRDLHFYIAHRFIHIRAVYKYVHSLHHRNADPEPFSGMTMHPVEHLYYFSNAFLPSLYMNLSPLIFLWNFIHLGCVVSCVCCVCVEVCVEVCDLLVVVQLYPPPPPHTYLPHALTYRPWPRGQVIVVGRTTSR